MRADVKLKCFEFKMLTQRPLPRIDTIKYRERTDRLGKNVTFKLHTR